MVTTSGKPSSVRRPGWGLRQVYWTLGNLLLFGGLYLLLYVGGVYADVAYKRLAARGDSDIEVPRAVMRAVEAPASLARQGPASAAAGRVAPDSGSVRAAERRAALSVAPAPTGLPGAESQAPAAEGQIASPPPPALAQVAHMSSVERLILPSVKLDVKVIEVGWQVLEQGGQQVAVWDVAEYAVGQHRGSANPGEGGNIVLAGHVGGYGQVFRDLYYVLPGEPVILYSEGREYRYVVKERLIVDEEGVSPAQQAANARLMASTDYEVVTMITCWPPKGPEKFTQRVIIQALPEDAAP